MNSVSGKKLIVMGFGLNFLINIAFILDLVASNIFAYSTSIINTLLNCGQYLSIGIAALGFLMMWSASKDMLDLLSCGATGLAALLGLMSSFRMINTGNQIASIIFSAMLSAFYVVLALRARKINIMFSLILICAYIYQVFSGMFFVNFLYGRLQMPFFIIFLIWFVGYAACAGMCFIEVKNEK